MTTTKPARAIERDPDIAAYVCPQCFGDDMDVSIETWARVIQHEDGVQTDVNDSQFGDHEWDEKSNMQCRYCGHCDESGKFDANNKKRTACIVTVVDLTLDDGTVIGKHEWEIVETLAGVWRILETAGDVESWDGWEWDNLDACKADLQTQLENGEPESITFRNAEDLL